MSGRKVFWLLVMMALTMFLSVPGYAWELEVQSVGIRGGINLEYVAIPPPEKEDFYQVDVVMYLALPWSWQYQSGWEMSWTFNGAAAAVNDTGSLESIPMDSSLFAKASDLQQQYLARQQRRYQQWRAIAGIDAVAGPGIAAAGRRPWQRGRNPWGSTRASPCRSRRPPRH